MCVCLFEKLVRFHSYHFSFTNAFFFLLHFPILKQKEEKSMRIFYFKNYQNANKIIEKNIYKIKPREWGGPGPLGDVAPEQTDCKKIPFRTVCLPEPLHSVITFTHQSSKRHLFSSTQNTTFKTKICSANTLFCPRRIFPSACTLSSRETLQMAANDTTPQLMTWEFFRKGHHSPMVLHIRH